MDGGSQKPVYRRKIVVRIVRYFLIIAIVPVAIMSVVLLTGPRAPLLQGAADGQQTLATNGSRQVDRYINTLTDQLAFAGQLYALDPGSIAPSLSTLLKQNADLRQIDFLTVGGEKRTAVRQGDEVKITTTKILSENSTTIEGLNLDTLANKSRILKLTHDINNMPQINLSMPIHDTKSGKFIGGIFGHYKVTDDTWNSIIPNQNGSQQTVYVVDDNGTLVYHPDHTVLSTTTDLKAVDAVHNFLVNNTQTQQTVSEANKQVLSTARTTKVGWGVVAERPLSDIYGGADAYTQLVVMVSIASIATASLVGLFFSGRLARPIRRLVIGARRLSENNFTKPINVKTKDELQELADIFNNLGVNINGLINNLQTNNRDLSYEHSRLQNIINSVNDGVVAVNAKQEIISANPSATRLVSHITTPLTGRPLSEVFPWTYNNAPLFIDMEYPGVRSYNEIVMAKGESVAYLDLMVEVTDRENSNVAAIITIHDQTSTRELSFMKLDFVAIAAHELRTPLTVISGYLDILNREAIHSLSVENLEDLQKAIIGTKQLGELINKLLNIARIERGDMEIFLDKLNLTQMVATSVEQHQPMAAQKQQVLAYTSDVSGTVYVPADPASITEVLNNLIGNAIKYTPEGGQIRVNIVATSEEVRVEIIDSGPGVPDELREKLFSKFYRAERSMITGTRGTGLGLFISKTIIELQKGTIGIAPQQSSGGSTFYFTLPVYLPERDDELITQNISRGRHGWFKKRTDH